MKGIVDDAELEVRIETLRDGRDDFKADVEETELNVPQEPAEITLAFIGDICTVVVTDEIEAGQNDNHESSDD